jgi:hypothetical protein
MPKTEKTTAADKQLALNRAIKPDKRKVMTPSNITNIMFREETKQLSKVEVKAMPPRSRALTARLV